MTHKTIQALKVRDKELIVLTREVFDNDGKGWCAATLSIRHSSRGGYAAVKTLNVSIARSVISRHIRAGLTQKGMAVQSGVRLETICRIEGGKQKPVQETIMRIQAALDTAENGGKKLDQAGV